MILSKIKNVFFSKPKERERVTGDIPEDARDIQPLLIGEKLPSSTFKTVDGQDVQLKIILEKKPTVLFFYRGGWCPYCNTQLLNIGGIEQQIVDLGYQAVAISPDDYTNLKNTTSNSKVKNTLLLSDPEGEFLKKIGLAFKTPYMVKEFAISKGTKGEVSEVIPVPSAMIINQKQEIVFEYINPNYKKRIKAEMLLAILKTI